MKLLKRLFLKRMEEADLNRESANAAAHYLKRINGKILPLKDQQDIVNYSAAGFYMGIRWHEEQMGAKSGKEK